MNEIKREYRVQIITARGLVQNLKIYSKTINSAIYNVKLHPRIREKQYRITKVEEVIKYNNNKE